MLALYSLCLVQTILEHDKLKNLGNREVAIVLIHVV